MLDEDLARYRRARSAEISARQKGLQAASMSMHWGVYYQRAFIAIPLCQCRLRQLPLEI
jgi:hypothetical protein